LESRRAFSEHRVRDQVDLARNRGGVRIACPTSGGGLRMHGGRRRSVIGGAALVSALVAVASTLAPLASAVPAPEVEYVYNVIVRRHFDFPNNDALGYGFALCDKVNRGVPYAVVMGDVKRDVLPNDEQSANYIVSYAVGILCPAQIWQLRNSAAGYVPVGG
jgi:hypothetical protein